MTIKEFPAKLKITQDDDTELEITVMLISKKLFNEGNVEVFVAVGYDSELKIHEVILNESKMVLNDRGGVAIRV